MEPKSEYCGSNTVDDLPEMSGPRNTAVLAYPAGANSQSVYQLSLYPITLKVIYLFPSSPLFLQSKNIYLVLAYKMVVLVVVVVVLSRFMVALVSIFCIMIDIHSI